MLLKVIELDWAITFTTMFFWDYSLSKIISTWMNVSSIIMLLSNSYRADTHLKPGAVVNILGEFDSNGYICIDLKQDNLLVVHPDFLVSGSVIASSTICVRK